MPTYIILVRGVTPSGKNKLPMARFREVLEAAGFTRVRTYIQSGNALVDTHLPASELGDCVHGLIGEKIGPDLAVIIRTGDELSEALEKNPFRKGYDISRIFFVLLSEEPQVDRIKNLLSLDIAPEKLAFSEKTAYMYIPGPYGRGTLSNNFIEKKLGITATMRNFKTLSRLAVMSRE